MTDEIKQEQAVEKVNNIDETPSTDESLKTDDETKEVDSKHIPYDRFKAKVDEANALKEKLAEIEREQAEAKRKELEEQENYKALYEQAVADVEAAKTQVLQTKKQTALTQAGYDAKQVALLTKLVEGETDEEIGESIKTLKLTFATQEYHGDPSANNGASAKPKTADASDIASANFERIKNKIFR